MLEKFDAEVLRAQAADARVNVEIETDEGMILNIGPQHPATHGTLRIVAKLDGEQVLWAEPIMGYMHRGYEKLAEVRNYPQITTIVNRIDWVAGYANEIPFIVAAEKLMELEVPPEAAEAVRKALALSERIPVITVDARDRQSARAALITVTEYAFKNLTALPG